MLLRSFSTQHCTVPYPCKMRRRDGGVTAQPPSVVAADTRVSCNGAVLTTVAEAQGSSHAAVGWEEGSRTICRTGCHVSSRDLPARAVPTPRRRRRCIRDSGIACRQTRPAFAGEKAALFKVSVMITVTVRYSCLFIPLRRAKTVRINGGMGRTDRGKGKRCKTLLSLNSAS